MDPPPPPPPPHGDNNGNYRKASDLPQGKYDIFVIPPHSAGGGFLYLPSLQCHRNSFIAGVVSTLLVVSTWLIVLPVVKDWFSTVIQSGGMGVILMVLVFGFGGWAWGKTQSENANAGVGGNAGPGPQVPPRPNYSAGPPPNTGPFPNGTAGGPPPPQPPPPQGAAPKPTWQRGAAGTGTASGAARGSWEKAREETRKKEEERRKAEELKKKREDAEKERQKQREKDARERLQREKGAKERLQREKDAKERLQREKDAKERVERERKEKERKEKEAKEAAARVASSPKKQEAPRTPSPTKPRHQPATAKTEVTEDDAYSFRPYDRPKRPASSVYSESSYAPSATTARTTPPPSHRGPYSTKDPDKIIIKAVYSFNNAFNRVPVAQLVSGQGSVTDGLILRITTEGLFIDDDVRGVPQREWDVKAWTLKLVEVWCPQFSASSKLQPKSKNTFLPKRTGPSSVPTSEESDQYLEKLLPYCRFKCRLGSQHPSSGAASSSFYSASSHASEDQTSSINDNDFEIQSGEMKGLHVLRAAIRDQEGKKYVFILQEAEGWKVAIGLQRLRRGTQVRALGVSGMPPNETKALIENLGWG